MALWGKTSATGRQGLDFRATDKREYTYLEQVPRELARNFATLAVVIAIAAMVLPHAPTRQAAAPAGPIAITVEPLEVASAN